MDLCLSSPNWSQLPMRVLVMIMDRLVLIDDYVQFGAVCHPWRIAFVEESRSSRKKQCSLPFLLIPPPEEENNNNNNQTRGLYSLSSKRVYDFQVRVPHNKFCRGSSFGWLVAMEKTDVRDFSVQLRNPFLSDDHIIDLPPLGDIVELNADEEVFVPYLYIRKSALSANPTFERNSFVIMAIMSSFCSLAFFKYGKNQSWSWTPIAGGWGAQRRKGQFFHDVIFFNKTQEFYAVEATGEVFAINVDNDDSSPTLTQVAPPTPIPSVVKRYLVESTSGDLLQVLKLVNGSGSFRNFQITVRFQVFKLEVDDGNWIQIHNLGDNILFLGDNTSISRSISDCPGCRPNCIYYTDDLPMDIHSRRRYGVQETGIFNLEDNSVQPHYPLGNKIVFPTPIWLEPTLGRFK